MIEPISMREALTRIRDMAASYINCHDDEIDKVMTDIVAVCDSSVAAPHEAEEGSLKVTPEGELELCPFCGGEAIQYPDHSMSIETGKSCIRTFVVCSDCSALVSGGTQDEAVSAWNRRTGDARSVLA